MSDCKGIVSVNMCDTCKFYKSCERVNTPVEKTKELFSDENLIDFLSKNSLTINVRCMNYINEND